MTPLAPRPDGIGSKGEKLQFVAGMYLTVAQTVERERQHAKDVASVRGNTK